MSFIDVNGAVPAKNFHSSSNDSSSSEGRLNNSAGVWCPGKNDTSPWLGVKLLTTSNIAGVAIQGSPKIFSQHVKSFSLRYSTNGEHWITYPVNGHKHVS